MQSNVKNPDTSESGFILHPASGALERSDDNLFLILLCSRELSFLLALGQTGSCQSLNCLGHSCLLITMLIVDLGKTTELSISYG
uniref:Uncharacterized protein n=1 Tax=Romanomermis culicivorax TaxID=13658 RepID=A0A915L9A4_ROMCU